MALQNLKVFAGLFFCFHIALGSLQAVAQVVERNADGKSEVIVPFTGDPNQKKNIFVFLDGTANDQKSQTNVWKMFQIVNVNKDPQITAFYKEGVGTVDNPLFGATLGKGHGGQNTGGLPIYY